MAYARVRPCIALRPNKARARLHLVSPSTGKTLHQSNAELCYLDPALGHVRQF